MTTDNETTRSDLRLYESDGNATMQSLYDLGDGFPNTCVNLMSRMVDTVPASVKLQEPIPPLDVKPINATFDFDTRGNLVVSGRIRVRTISSLTRPFSFPRLQDAYTGAQRFFPAPVDLEILRISEPRYYPPTSL